MTSKFKTYGWRTATAVAALSLMVMVAGCAKAKGDSAADKRAYIQEMATDSMATMDKLNPGVKHELSEYAGWGVFETVQTQALITTTNNGYGLVHSNGTGKEYYMKGFGLGAGLGVGIKASRVIAIFETPEVLNKFVTDGWSWGASGSATAKAVSVEGEAVGEHKFTNGVKVYLYTDNGLMAGVALKGGKVWLDKDLN